jgi:glucose-6-phosphate 1-dehydrogenase
MAQENGCIIAIFGASGDLTKRKLMPALYALFRQKLLPDNFAILGTSRSPFTDDAYRKKIIEDVVTYKEIRAEAARTFLEARLLPRNGRD